MTAKDLHFSFDSPLAQAPPARLPQDTPPGAGKRATKPGKPPRLAPATANRAGTPGVNETSARRAWITASLVSLINMAFLVLAALWLTGATSQLPGFEGALAPADPLQPAVGVEELQAEFDATRRQLSELGAAVAAQSDLLLAIQAQLAARAPQESTAGSEPAPLPTEESVAADDWQINLGSFASAADAAKLQAELAAMGYSAQVRGPAAQGEPEYNLWLGGYDSREAADTAAHRLMDQTNLTGLWVWKAH